MEKLIKNSIARLLVYLTAAVIVWCTLWTISIIVDITTYNNVKEEFNWMDKELYTYLVLKCDQKDLDPIFMLAVAQIESGGKNIRSHNQNSNGTYDHGLWQINEVHVDYDIDKVLLLYQMEYSTNMATDIMKVAIDESYRFKYIAAIKYNAGPNCDLKKYKNIYYPIKIMKKYNKAKRNLGLTYYSI